MNEQLKVEELERRIAPVRSYDEIHVYDIGHMVQ